LALSVSQELHKRWVLSKKPSNYHYTEFRNFQQLLSEPPYNVPFSISRITLPSLREPYYLDLDTVSFGRLVFKVKFGIQKLYKKTKLLIPIHFWYILLQHLYIYNNIPQTRNCNTVLKILDNTHNRHEHKFPCKENVDEVFKSVFAGLSNKTLNNGNTLDEYQLYSIAHLRRIQNYSRYSLERQFQWVFVFGEDEEEEVDELAVYLDEDINEFAYSGDSSDEIENN